MKKKDITELKAIETIPELNDFIKKKVTQRKRIKAFKKGGIGSLYWKDGTLQIHGGNTNITCQIGWEKLYYLESICCTCDGKTLDEGTILCRHCDKVLTNKY